MRDMVQILFLTFTCVGTLVFVIFQAYLRLANPDMTETRLLLTYWPQLGIIGLFTILCLAGLRANSD